MAEMIDLFSIFTIQLIQFDNLPFYENRIRIKQFPIDTFSDRNQSAFPFATKSARMNDRAEAAIQKTTAVLKS